MSAQSHGTPAKKSDLPWIAGSILIFGPMFLYLLSPSARKSQNEHAIHNDKHDFPTLEKEKQQHQSEEKASEIMKDDEGTPADVTQSVALSEQSDVPQDSQSQESTESTRAAASEAPVGDEAGKKTEDKDDSPKEETQPASEKPSEKSDSEGAPKVAGETPMDTSKTSTPPASTPNESTAEKIQG